MAGNHTACMRTPCNMKWAVHVGDSLRRGGLHCGVLLCRREEGCCAC